MTDRAELLTLIDDIEAEVDRRFAAIAVKAGGYAAVRADYKRTLDDVLSSFGTSDQGVKVTAAQNELTRAMVEAFQSAFDLGYIETSGDEQQADKDAQDWLNARVEAEMGYIKEMFQSLKDLRDQARAGDIKVADVRDFVAQRVEGYTSSLDNVNGMGKLYGNQNQLLTFDGEDGGADSCKPGQGCKKWKGKRFKAKTWIAKGLVERNGNPNFQCGRWDTCFHHFFNDKGEMVIE